MPKARQSIRQNSDYLMLKPSKHAIDTHPEYKVEDEQKVLHTFHSSFYLPHVGWML
ncbi:hypothetical protein ATANTOWER_011298, partial [Ataeniobius toweri]|nr:hypothetical protein [Ataeniobius toweri]